MGSVRLTKDRANRICRLAIEAFNTANPEPTLSAEIRDLIWQGAVNDPTQVALRQFVEKHKSELNARDIGITQVRAARVNYKFTMDGGTRGIEYLLPTERVLFGGRNHYTHQLKQEHLRGISYEERVKIDEAARECVTQREELEKRARQFRQEIKRLLSECNTLKQLLESWPAAKEFVDPDDIRQMHEKITRKQAAKRRIDTSGVDIDSLNQVVLTSKLVA